MNLPFEYEHVTVGEFGGTTPTTTDFANARVVILPIPLDRTTSYVHGIGIVTLPEMELPFATMDEVMQEIRRVAAELVNRGKFPLILGGEHSITPAVVAAVA